MCVVGLRGRSGHMAFVAYSIRMLRSGASVDGREGLWSSRWVSCIGLTNRWGEPTRAAGDVKWEEWGAGKLRWKGREGLPFEGVS